jgi:uncharacterized protein (DUF427 family)
MKAIWNDQVIAESDNTIVIENNHYFPADSIKKEYFKSSEDNTDAAWFYPKTSHAAKAIEGHIAFWKGVKVTN